MSENKIMEEVIEETVGSVSMEPNPSLEPSAEEQERMAEVKSLIDAESLDPTTSMNIIINAVQVAFNTETFNDLDRYLIAKSLDCFKSYVDKGEDLVIKTK
jgi:hypothetical protein